MIDLVDVSKSYGPGLPAVNHVNLHIDKGEFVFIVGNSGSGKTTLVKLLMKELDSTSGQITVSGERLEGMKHRRVAKYRRKLGVVFQDFRLLKDRNVYENVAFAQRVVNRPTRVIRKRVPEVLQEVLPSLLLFLPTCKHIRKCRADRGSSDQHPAILSEQQSRSKG